MNFDGTTEEGRAAAAAYDEAMSRAHAKPGCCSRSPLTVEQKIRAWAALAARPPHGTRSQLDVAEELADWIRTGERPA